MVFAVERTVVTEGHERDVPLHVTRLGEFDTSPGIRASSTTDSRNSVVLFAKVIPVRGNAFAGVGPNRRSAADKSATKTLPLRGEWSRNVEMADALFKHLLAEALLDIPQTR
jgi:hypothetical protein